MKHSILIIFLSFLTLTNCSTDNDDYYKEQVYRTYWHLINVSGGIAGVDNNFDLNKIVWTFDDETHTLTVSNTNTTDVEDGFDTGEYTYSVTEDANKEQFLTIESNEFGHMTISETELIINQNMTTNGSGADGFMYTFKRVLVLEEVE
ncbi:hypothetical protein [Mariniflexile sp. AS56]|uniref:hypothetical protein n=1 Tax=Mariniflexile sp. AS56 TaxID=3063957 RepID=UPI0026F15530|nr:hypothetical protein [Mariniflexile sp. AS56]MDO7171685.1 hypothetical protein [Mariniflexile sp. AS56]